VFREKIASSTWVAIAAVIAGISVMVSNAVTGQISPIGDGLALVIPFAFAIATVTTRRHRSVRMVPATTLAVVIALACSVFLAKVFVVSWVDFGWLAAFGAINLAAGLILFSFGARMIPAAVAALVGTLEPVFGPVWVWLAHGEVPGSRTLIGGVVVLAALIFHFLFELLSTKRT
jgi:drug/metabolite transporter (DMT)-like permease